LCNACVTGQPDPPATGKQLEYLRLLGVEVPAKLGKKQASRLISEALEKRPPAPTEKQLDYLRDLYVPDEVLASLSQPKTDELVYQAYAARDYAWQLFDEEFLPKRGSGGRFAKGSHRGVSGEFAERETGRMRRFILADPQLRATVEAMIVKGVTRHGIPHDDVWAAVLANLERPGDSKPESGRQQPGLLAKMFGWFFSR
jgi:hypothetical protein